MRAVLNAVVSRDNREQGFVAREYLGAIRVIRVSQPWPISDVMLLNALARSGACE